MPRLTPAMLAVALIAAAVLVGAALHLASRWHAAQRLKPDAQLVYKRIDGHALTLNVFRPRAPRPGVPTSALLLLHGGGWQVGDAAQFHPQCRFFSDRGLTCFTALYRTASPHGTTPADALQDARDAVRHLRRHAAELGIAADRLIVGGGSAGGHLAAALGTGVPSPDPGADPGVPTRPDALVLYNPMLDLSPGMPDHAPVADQWLALSPRQHIGPATPPTLILNGSADPEVAVSTVNDFCQAMRGHGRRCEVHIHEGAGHGFFNAGVEGGKHFRRTNAEVAAFLETLGHLQAAPR